MSRPLIAAAGHEGHPHDDVSSGDWNGGGSCYGNAVYDWREGRVVFDRCSHLYGRNLVTAPSPVSLMSWPATLVRAAYLPDKSGAVELYSGRIAFGEHSIERAGARLELVRWCEPIHRTTLGAALRV